MTYPFSSTKSSSVLLHHHPLLSRATTLLQHSPIIFSQRIKTTPRFRFRVRVRSMRLTRAREYWNRLRVVASRRERWRMCRLLLLGTWITNQMSMTMKARYNFVRKRVRCHQHFINRASHVFVNNFLYSVCMTFFFFFLKKIYVHMLMVIMCRRALKQWRKRWCESRHRAGVLPRGAERLKCTISLKRLSSSVSSLIVNNHFVLIMCGIWDWIYLTEEEEQD